MFSLGDKVYFDADTTNLCKGYKGGISVLSDNKISLYDMTSSTTVSEYHGYRDAAICTSDKYMLVYDRKSSAYSVYSAFSKLGDFKTERSVRLASLADDGTHLLVLDSGEFFSSILIYNSNFKIVNRIDKYKYVTAADITTDGKTVAVASSYVGDRGAFVSEILLLETGKSTAKETLTVDGSLIYDVRFFDDGSFVAVCDTSLRFYSKSGEYEESVPYSYGFPDYYLIDGDNIIFINKKDTAAGTLEFISYSKSREQNSHTEIKGAYKDMCATTHEAYILLDDKIAVISVMSGKLSYTDLPEGVDKNDAVSLVRGANEDVYVCTTSFAAKVKK